jgi:hypothetical protein
MASLHFVVTMTDGSTVTKTVQVADGDVARLLAAYAPIYQMPDPNDPTGATMLTPANTPASWTVGKWIEGIIAGSLAFVKSHETAVAQSQAAAGVNPIAVTMS